MSMMNILRRRSKKYNDEQKARIRVGGRGGAYIPSEEIAALPEVQSMQKMAAAIVSRNMTTTRK